MGHDTSPKGRNVKRGRTGTETSDDDTPQFLDPAEAVLRGYLDPALYYSDILTHLSREKEQDARQAWTVVSLAAKDEPRPFVTSSYLYHGTHPEQLFAKLTAERKGKLGKEYDEWFDGAGNLKSEPNWLEIPDYDPTSEFKPRTLKLRKPTRGSIAANAGCEPKDGRSSPKAPLRLVVSRCEVRGETRVLYHEEQLECGHSHIEMLDANPGNRRRRCRACLPVVS